MTQIPLNLLLGLSEFRRFNSERIRDPHPFEKTGVSSTLFDQNDSANRNLRPLADLLTSQSDLFAGVSEIDADDSAQVPRWFFAGYFFVNLVQRRALLFTRIL